MQQHVPLANPGTRNASHTTNPTTTSRSKAPSSTALPSHDSEDEDLKDDDSFSNLMGAMGLGGDQHTAPPVPQPRPVPQQKQHLQQLQGRVPQPQSTQHNVEDDVLSLGSSDGADSLVDQGKSTAIGAARGVSSKDRFVTPGRSMFCSQVVLRIDASSLHFHACILRVGQNCVYTHM
jgi:hypothetical protein